MMDFVIRNMNRKVCTNSADAFFGILPSSGLFIVDTNEATEQLPL
jgi:hypothetical protein